MSLHVKTDGMTFIYQNEGDGFGSDKMGNVKVECIWCKENILFFLYCMILVLFEFNDITAIQISHISSELFNG